MKKVRINYSVRVHYNQVCEVDDETYERLNKYDGEDIMEGGSDDMPQAYNDVLDLTDHNQFMMGEEINSFSIESVEEDEEKL